VADPLPPILIPEGHEPPSQPRDRSTLLWRLAVVLLVIVAVVAVVLLDRSPSKDANAPGMGDSLPAPARTP
jgi:anti-sigma-K factor RskA